MSDLSDKHPAFQILIAPACFKGTLSAATVAKTIWSFLSARLPESVELMTCPIADGGDDTLSVLQSVDADFRSVRTTVTGPLSGMAVQAEILFHLQRKQVVIEAAQVHGLTLLSPESLAPLNATSYGVGELLRLISEGKSALFPESWQPRQIILTLGGSASTDGGAGALQALGFQLLDQDGKTLEKPVSGGTLTAIHQVLPPRCWAYSGEIKIATDVQNPLLGVQGAATVFAPQKGASPAECLLLEAGLKHWHEQLQEGIKKGLKENSENYCPANRKMSISEDLSALPGTGAAGGLAYGLRHLPGAEIISGSRWIAEQLKLDAKIADADLIITGEGQFDLTSFSGKATGYLLSQSAKKPVLMVCGKISQNLKLPANLQVYPIIGSESEDIKEKTALLQPEAALLKRLETLWPDLKALLP